MKEKRSKLTDLLALTVFAVFALCVLLVLLSGAKVYRGLVQRGEENFAARTAARYVTMRVRQARTVTVGDFEGCEALVIPENVDGATYLTRLYVYDGHIRELHCPAVPFPLRMPPSTAIGSGQNSPRILTVTVPTILVIWKAVC